MGAFQQLRDQQLSTREAATLTGVSRTTVYRKPSAPQDHIQVVPPNKLSTAERDEVMAALNSGVAPGKWTPGSNR